MESQRRAAVVGLALNRLAPLAQLPETMYAFFTKRSVGPWARIMLRAYYLLLKLMAVVPLLLVPVYALWVSWRAAEPLVAIPLLDLLLGLLVGVAFFALAEVALADTIYFIRTTRFIATPVGKSG